MIAYLHYEAPVEEQNFATLLEMLNTMQVLEDDENTRTLWTCCLRNWKKRSPTALPGGSTNFTSWLPVIYALSDFLIMILSWLVKQSLRAFLFQEVQP